MFDFVICDRSPISVQRIMDKKFDEDVDVCEKTAYIEKKAAEEKQQKKLEKIKDEYLKKVKETEDEYLKKCKEVEDEYKKECKVIGERYNKIIQQLYETATEKGDKENLGKDEQNFSMSIRQCLFRRWAEVNEIEISADLNNKIKIKDVLDEMGEAKEENDIIKEFRRNLYSNIDIIMGDIEIDGKKIRAHEALTEGKKKSKLTIDNYVFFKSVLLDDDIEAGNNIIEMIDENRSLELGDREKDIIRYGLYSLANNPNMLITDKMVKERLEQLFGTEEDEAINAYEDLGMRIEAGRCRVDTEEQYREYFRGVKRILDQCEIQIYDLSSRFKGRGESIDEFMKDVYTPPKPPKVNIFEKKFERQQMLEWDRKRTVFKMSMSDTEEQ